MASQITGFFRRSSLMGGALALALTSVVGLPTADAAKQSCRNGAVDVSGTSGNDILRIEAQAAKAGAKDGLFIVHAGNGNDTVDFTTSALVALQGVKVCISGGSGNDSLYGTDGKDVIDGGAGNDVLVGYAGNDKLSGGKGKDDLFGGAGRDKLVGGSGSDFLYGAEGKDKLFPGAGNDTTVTGTDKNIVENSGGTDLIVAEPYVITVNGKSTKFKGSGSANTITGGKGDDFIFGGKGADTITDARGDNWLVGRGGNDTLTGGNGTDTIFGGSGADKIVCGSDAGDWASGGTVTYTPDSSPGDQITTGAASGSDQVASDCETVFTSPTTFTLIDKKARTSSDISPASVSGAGVASVSADLLAQDHRAPRQVFPASR